MATRREMESRNLFGVVKILAKDRVFGKNWKLFCLGLNFDQSTMFTLENMESRNNSLQDIIIDIMKHWESMSSCDANLTNLSNILRDMGCAKSADDINAYSNATETGLIWFNMQSPTKFYTGRDNEMKMIEKQWEDCEKRKSMLFVAITGLEGIGKSELVRNFAKQFHENIKGHSIWIDAETDQTLSQSFQSLALDLNISLDDISGKEKGQNILMTELYEKISVEKCLIVFDNLESYENSILTLLITIASKKPPTSRRPFVLVTSRYRPAIKLLGDHCINLELNVLSKESALKLFSKSFSIPNQDSTPVNTVLLMEKLSERLHYYPLAMQQTAAYIKESLFNKSTNDLEKEIANYLDAFMTLDKIRIVPEIGVTAVKMMEIISFLSPDNISEKFLMKLFEKQGNPNQQTNKSTKYLEVIRDHSMISLCEKQISNHRLAQEVTRIRLNEEGKMIECLDRILTRIQSMLINDEIPFNQMIHAQTIWSYASRNKKLIEKHGNVPGWICQRLFEDGKFRLIKDFICQTLIDLETTLGEKSRWTLKIKYWKGTALQMLGEYPKSLDVLNGVYEKQKQMFGVEDNDSLCTVNQMANVHWTLKNYDEALKLYGDALNIAESREEHAHALDLKDNVAAVLDAQGKNKEAMDMYREILNVRERVSGKEHPCTLSTKHNLAGLRYKLKEYEDALKMFLEVVEVRQRVLGLDNLDTLSTKSSISETYVCLGRLGEAFQLAKEVYERRLNVLGPTHPHTIRAKNDVERMEMGLNTVNISRTD